MPHPFPFLVQPKWLTSFFVISLGNQVLEFLEEWSPLVPIHWKYRITLRTFNLGEPESPFRFNCKRITTIRAGYFIFHLWLIKILFHK